MNNNSLMALISGGVILLSVLLQTTIFRYLTVFGAGPDLALICLIYFSVNRGRNTGQVLGFVSGLAESFLSSAPLGFFSLIKVILGYLLGCINGVIVLDKILFPVIFVMISTFTKQVMSLFIDNLFSANLNIQGIFTTVFFAELGYNVLLTPFVFLLLTMLSKRILLKRERV